MLPKEEKKIRFLERQAKADRNRKLFLGLGVVLMLSAILIFGFNNYYNRVVKKEGGYYIGQTVSYEGTKIMMSDTEAKIEDGKFKIDLNTVIDNKIVGAKYSDGKTKFYNGMDYLPLVFYVTGSGRVAAASAICEPCMGQKFYIEGSDLVCVACGTHWNLEDLQGISGGCTNYPPEEFKFKVENKQIVIDETVLQNWKGRQI